jgi:hypothetical protein
MMQQSLMLRVLSSQLVTVALAILRGQQQRGECAA